MRAGTDFSDYLTRLKAALDAISIADLEGVAERIESAWRQGRTVFLCGNGGSAATASHMACDLAKTTLGKQPRKGGKRLRALALTDNMPLVSAWSNDASYEVAFAEQLRNLAESGDLLIAISASGNSPNVLRALEAAKQLGVATIGFLGFDGGKARELVDLALVIASDDYGIVEDAHSVLMHMLTARMRSVLSSS